MKKTNRFNQTETLPFPIFDSVEHYYKKSHIGPVRSYAKLRLANIIKDQQNINSDWLLVYLELADRFLIRYLKGVSGPINTFNRFKVEVERFTLWLVIEHKKNPLELEADDITAYLKFLSAPKISWISAYNTKRLIYDGDKISVNDHWKPFWARRPKGTKLPSFKPNDENAQELRRQYDFNLIASYAPTNSTLKAALRALSPFFNFLIDQQKKAETEAKCNGDKSCLISTQMHYKNPVTEAAHKFKKQNLIPSIELADGRKNSLNKRQWNLIIETLITLRDAPNATENQRKKWTRALFIITFMKANMLRVSEISKTRFFNPKMSNIRKVVGAEKKREYWEYSFIGIGNKKRIVVLPSELLTYLVDYRRSRGLSDDFPDENDHSPLIARLKAKLDNNGNIIQEYALTYPAIRDQIQFVFNAVVKHIEKKAQEKNVNLNKDIRYLKKASTFWLRHTGANMALDDGEDILSVSENLGYTDCRMVNQIYNKDNHIRKAAIASKRKV